MNVLVCKSMSGAGGYAFVKYHKDTHVDIVISHLGVNSWKVLNLSNILLPVTCRIDRIINNYLNDRERVYQWI